MLSFADKSNNRTNLNAVLVKLKSNKVLLALTIRAPKIFISYRRDDSAGHAGRLYADLMNRFSINQIFFDIDAILPGEDFANVIQQAVSSCDVMVAVIGKQWLDIADGGVSKLDNPQDFVRLEISTAINRNIPIIPVLIQGAKMPRPEDVPKTLEAITRLQFLEISDNRWNDDIRRLNIRLKQVIPKRIVSWQTIGITAVSIILLTLGVVALTYMRSHSALTNTRGDSIQISSPVKEVYAFESDNKLEVRFGIGKESDPNKTSFYMLNYIFKEKVCGEFVERIRTSVYVGENFGAQQIFDKGLNEAQRDFLIGPITSKAKRLVSEAKAKRLLSGDKDEELNTLIKDEDLDTMIAGVADMR